MKINNLEAGSLLKYAGGILIVIFIIFSVKSVKIYKKYTAAKAFYALSLNRREGLTVKLSSLERLKTPAGVFGGHGIGTYLFTFLSFSNYINGKGYGAAAYLEVPSVSKPPSGGRPGTITRAQAGNYKELSSYITDSKSFYAMKKISLSLKVKDYTDVKTVLKIIGDVQSAFPARIKSILITNKLAVINFNIYGEE